MNKGYSRGVNRVYPCCVQHESRGIPGVFWGCSISGIRGCIHRCAPDIGDTRYHPIYPIRAHRVYTGILLYYPVYTGVHGVYGCTGLYHGYTVNTACIQPVHPVYGRIRVYPAIQGIWGCIPRYRGIPDIGVFGVYPKYGVSGGTPDPGVIWAWG